MAKVGIAAELLNISPWKTLLIASYSVLVQKNDRNLTQLSGCMLLVLNPNMILHFTSIFPSDLGIPYPSLKHCFFIEGYAHSSNICLSAPIALPNSYNLVSTSPSEPILSSNHSGPGKTVFTLPIQYSAHLEV